MFALISENVHNFSWEMTNNVFTFTIFIYIIILPILLYVQLYVKLSYSKILMTLNYTL